MIPNHASSITKAASKQTYYIFRYLVDRQRIPDAYRAYAYFPWIDDWVDQMALENSERIAFIDRQKVLMDSCYQG
jgi:phytoene/squalene synthetase